MPSTRLVSGCAVREFKGTLGFFWVSFKEQSFMIQQGKEKGKIIIHADIDLEDLIPGFLNNQLRDTTRMVELLDSADYLTIQRMGHSMKGSGGGYGFEEITAIGMRIESAAGEEDAAEIRRQVEALRDYLKRVEVIYD